MTLHPFLAWIENTGFATAIRESDNLFPWVESIHVLAIVSVVGTIGVVDLRLLGLSFRDRPVSELMGQVLAFTRAAFVVAALTGVMLFVSHATDYMQKTPFVAKLVLLGLALANIVVFHLHTVRDIHTWDAGAELPVKVKFAGGTSLALWIAIVGCGRWVGFV